VLDLPPLRGTRAGSLGERAVEQHYPGEYRLPPQPGGLERLVLLIEQP
jgi:hypothetical protein